MRKQQRVFKAAIALLTCSHLPANAQQEEIQLVYEERFTNTAGSNQLLSHGGCTWQFAYGAGANTSLELGSLSSGPAISPGAGSDGVSGNVSYWSGFSEDKQPHFLHETSAVFTNTIGLEGPEADYLRLVNFSFSRGTSGSANAVRPALKIGDQWYVTTTSYTNDTANMWIDRSLEIQSANWTRMEFVAGSVLLTGAETGTLAELGATGRLESVGMLGTTVLSTNAQWRIDSVEIWAAPFVPELPFILTQPVGQSREVGQAATLSVEAIGEEPLEYQWFRNNEVIPGATGSSLEIPTVGHEDAGNYHVRVSNPNGSVLSDEVVLFVAQVDLNGPEIHYSFDLFDNDTVADLTAPFSDGQLRGNVARTDDGIEGRGIAFDGGAGRLEFDARGSGSISFATWIYRTGNGNASGYDRILDTPAFAMTINHSTMATGLLVKTSAGDVSFTGQPGTIKNNKWTHIALSYDGTDPRNIPSLYVDGQIVPVKTTAILPIASFTLMDGAGAIGNRVQGDRGFLGIMDEVRIYHRAVSQPEISAFAMDLPEGRRFTLDELRWQPRGGRPGWLADANRNGVPEVMEIAAGLSGTDANAHPALLSMILDGSDGVAEFHYTRAYPPLPVQPRIEVSHDLTLWSDPSDGASVIPGEVSGSMQEMTARISASPGQPLFARLALRDTRALETFSRGDVRDLWARMMRHYASRLNSTRNRGPGNDYEIVTRTIWSLAAWFYHEGRPDVIEVDGVGVDIRQLLLDNLRNGTNPNIAGRWPNGYEAAQPTVEAGNVAWATWALADAFARNGTSPWADLDSSDLTHIFNWLDSADQNTGSGQRYYHNNWNLFLVLNQEARHQLHQLGHGKFSQYDLSVVDEAMRRVQQFHRGRGWYADRSDGIEYEGYGDWTLVSHQLLYYMMNPALVVANDPIPGSGPRRPSDLLYDVSRYFATQPFFYDSKGAHPEWGRSSTYKYARLVSMILAHALDQRFNHPDGWNLGFRILPESFPLGQLRRLVRQHINYYLSIEMIDPVTFAQYNGQTRYTPSAFIEGYSAPGSHYWSMITFAALWLLQDDDPFWSAEEVLLPSESGSYLYWLPIPTLVMSHDYDLGHLEAFNLGNSKTPGGDLYSRKYEKFVYSSRIGFLDINAVNMDQAITLDGSTRHVPAYADFILSHEEAAGDGPGVGRTLSIINNWAVGTVIFFKDGAHVRVHQLTRLGGAESVTMREGGYAHGHNNDQTLTEESGPNWHYFASADASVFTQFLLGYESILIDSGSGRHTRHQNHRLAYGECVGASDGAVFALLSSGSRGPQDVASLESLVHDIQIDGNTVRIVFSDGSTQAMDFPRP